MHRFTATTIGCKVNQYETQAAAALLRRFGLIESVADPSGPACRVDLIIINTCCVTSSAAGKSRRAVRKAVRRHPYADVVILGCYATADGQVLRQAATQAGTRGKIHIIGHRDDAAERLRLCASSLLKQSISTENPRSCDYGREKSLRLEPTGPARNERRMRACPYQHPVEDLFEPDPIEPSRQGDVKKNFQCLSVFHDKTRSRMMSEANRADNSTIPTDSLRSSEGFPPIEIFTGHQRAFVKVQDGCDAFCTYCIIPHLRSRVWSRSADEIISEVAGLVANGHREVVLCGVFLGAFGRTTAVRRKWTGPDALPELLRRVAETPGLWRVRLSSLEPGDVTDELLKIFSDRPAVAPHLHLPLQSGSNRILKRMNRQYDADQFLNAVRRVRETLDEPAITTDIVVGFPGETEDDFAATLRVARQAGFSRIHIFPYSPRPGTAAWTWRTEAAPPETVKTRHAQLAELGREMVENFRRRFIDRTVEVLVEKPNTKTPPGCARGLTDRYIETTFPPNHEGKNLWGQVVRVHIEGVTHYGLNGRLLAESQA